MSNLIKRYQQARLGRISAIHFRLQRNLPRVHSKYETYQFVCFFNRKEIICCSSKDRKQQPRKKNLINGDTFIVLLLFLPHALLKDRNYSVFSLLSPLFHVQRRGSLLRCCSDSQIENTERNNVGNWPNIVPKRNCRNCNPAPILRIQNGPWLLNSSCEGIWANYIGLLSPFTVI